MTEAKILIDIEVVVGIKSLKEEERVVGSKRMIDQLLINLEI
jgi:hypothetical protein